MKLELLKQWVCDVCGKIIEKPEDGYVQFHKDNNGKYDDFIIVHHLLASPRKNISQNGCYIYDLDLDLESFLGEKGIGYLLSFLDPGPYHVPDFKSRVSNIRKWVELMRRLHVPYYEEARLYWNRASADGYFYDSNEIYIYSPENLKDMIEHYEKEDE